MVNSFVSPSSASLATQREARRYAHGMVRHGRNQSKIPISQIKKRKDEDVEGKGPSVRLHYRGFGLPVVGVAISARELFLPSNRQ